MAVAKRFEAEFLRLLLHHAHRESEEFYIVVKHVAEGGPVSLAILDPKRMPFITSWW